MEIVVFNNGTLPSSLQPALLAEGHRVKIAAADHDHLAADLVMLDASTWSPAQVATLTRRLPHAELVVFVDTFDQSLPAESAMALVKPLDVNKLVRLVRIIDEARSGVGDPRDLLDFETLFCGDSPAIVELLRQVRLLAQSDAPVWLHGELGSGRAVVARAIHDRSMRQNHMFMAINAASFPGDLLEEHLFAGDEPLVQRANGGTVFIDSVTELAPGVQAKLLRMLEECTLRLRGIDHPIDVRVMVGDERRTLNVGGRLRKQLYFRLKVHELDLPALREREGDLGAIMRRILDRLRTGGRVPSLSISAARTLESYPFPGNVRELAHALTHAVILAQGGPIQIEHLPFDIQKQPIVDDEPLDPESLESLDAVAKRFERTYLVRVLRAVGGNRTRAAKILNLSRKGLWQKLKAHGIAAAEGRAEAEDESDDVG